ncbi:MAG: aminopeptidase N [Halothiobacillaceae bacterium]
MKADTPVVVRLSDYRAPDFLLDSVELTFVLEPHATRVTAVQQLRRHGDHDRPLVLNGRDLVTEAVTLDGQTLTPGDDFTVDDQHLTLANPPAKFTLTVQTTIDPGSNTALEGLYLSSGNFCTQCEPEGFRRITWFLDRPDVLARYTVHIEADRNRYPVLLSNGNPTASEDLPGGRHRATWVDPHPKPSYLFALVAGDLACLSERYKTGSGREVALNIYVQHHNRDRCAHAMVSLKKAMTWDEEAYGREYDLDVFNIVAVDDFNMGAMENKGLNIFNSRYVLARPETATDADYDGIESVVAHEYFHNWSGNRVTCRDWFQLSLKEGFTVFRDQEFSADMGSRAVRRIQDVNLLKQFQFAEDAGPQAHPVQPQTYQQINNFYTSTVYNKGAEVVRMLRNLLGWETFRAGCDLYFARHDGQAVTIEDFVAVMESVSGRDLTQFRRWYAQAGTPRVQVTDHHDPERQQYRLTLAQSCPPTPGQPDKQPFQIPIAIALFSRDGLQLVEEQVVDLVKARQEVVFEGIATPPVPSMNRGFTAPIRLEYDHDDAALALLASHDTDLFNRWDAMQRLMLRVIMRRVEALTDEDCSDPGELALDPVLSGAFGQLLHGVETDPMFTAEALSLPTEGYVAEQYPGSVPVDAIHQAREELRRALAEEWEAALGLVYRNQVVQGPFRPGGRDAGKRRVQRIALDYLASLSRAAWYQTAWEQFEQADNMTDSLNALAVLAHADCPQRETALAQFGTRWHDDPLVMDKWFSLQATSPLPATLDRVETLRNHPAFSIRNPNKVRALIGAFARGNPLHFHAADGSGYRWVAERIIELDALNPQVAARMAGAFNRWEHYDSLRRAMMKAQLERIMERPECSSDVAEIVGKALKG